jgi:hypothetical protein
LDFESLNIPLPRFKGETPYTQSLFQYSLHVEKVRGQCDKDKDNYQFVASSFGDERLQLVESMLSHIDLSHGGTVIVYNKQFEQTRLKELAKYFPDYAKPLMLIHDSIFDLMDLLVRDGIKFYSNSLHGSFSIKKVMPHFCPNVSYHDLTVQNGNMAMDSYIKMKDATKEKIAVEVENLKEYCGQDTWSMVEVLWGIYRTLAKHE